HDLQREREELERKHAQFKQALQQSKDQLVAERDYVHQKEKALDDKAHKLEQKLGQLKRADAATRARREKLHRYRKLLRQSSERIKAAKVKTRSASQQFAGLDKERQMLVEVKRFLESSEAEMVRRWSTHKAASLVMAAVMMLIVVA